MDLWRLFLFFSISQPPVDGVIVYGLFIEGARWCETQKSLVEQLPKVVVNAFPLVHFTVSRLILSFTRFTLNSISIFHPITHSLILLPSPYQPMLQSEFNEKSRYKCPLYKTSERKGVLSTTGHSTNFVIALMLDTMSEPEHWIKRGVAMILQTND